MKSRIAVLWKLSLLFVIFSMVSRLFFILYQHEQSSTASSLELLSTFLYGLRLDLSLTGYLMLLFSLVLAVSVLFNGRWIQLAVDTLTILFLVLFSLIVIVDAELYVHWGFRMDTTPLLYIDDPNLALASTSNWLIVLLLLGWFLFAALFVFCYFRWIRPEFKHMDKCTWIGVPVFLILAVMMVIPIRGSFGIAPINTGMVFFSRNSFVNHATINVIWNFLYDLTNSGRTSLQVRFMSDEEAENYNVSLTQTGGERLQIISNPRPNVVILILESFSANVIGAMGGTPGVTPCLDGLWKEGVSFDHMFATGMRSDRGLVAILSGYPSHPDASVMKYPQKTQHIKSVCEVMNHLGYATSFYYGGDTDFANMNSYLVNSGFHRVVNQDAFPESSRNSKWGVHDEIMFRYLQSELDTARQPFYKAFFTLSSHEPFDVPMKSAIRGNSNEHKYMNSVYYTDSCLGEFIRIAKTKEWWKNTLIVLVADHGFKYPSDLTIDTPQRYAIPMLWLGGVVKDSLGIKTYCNQYDIPSTLLGQMGLSDSAFVFSRDILASQDGGHAMYIYNQGYGFITPLGYLVYNVDQDKFTKASGDTTSLSIKSKALFQTMIHDFNQR